MMRYPARTRSAVDFDERAQRRFVRTNEQTGSIRRWDRKEGGTGVEIAGRDKLEQVGGPGAQKSRELSNNLEPCLCGVCLLFISR